MRICTVGDLLLDVVIRLDRPFTPDTDTYGESHAGAGGQAANVAAWTVALGGSARLIARRAADSAGRLLTAELRRRGVDVVGPEVERGTGTVVSVATPDGARTMLTDRGISPGLEPHELDPAWLGDCDWLHVPGYSLARAPLRQTALAAAQAVRNVSVDASSTAAIEEAGRAAFSTALAELAPSVVFANEDEAALLDKPAATFVVKRGARGCLVRRDADERAYEAVPAEVVDSTGAGDAFAAGFLLGGAELALRAAARCVGKLGAMP